MADGADPIQYPAADSAAAAAAAAAASAAGHSRRRSAGSEPLQRLRRLALAPLPAGAAAEPALAKGGGKAAARGGGRGRSTKRKGGPAAQGGAPAAGACERGMLVVILDELDSLLTGELVLGRGLCWLPTWAARGWCRQAPVGAWARQPRPVGAACGQGSSPAVPAPPFCEHARLGLRAPPVPAPLQRRPAAP